MAGRLAVGVDVSATRGLDVVALAARGRVVPPVLRRVVADELDTVLRKLAPDVVAIDSPPAWGIAGRSRACERAVRALGMGIFSTPSDPAVFAHPFYAWMVAGHAAFAAARRAGYPLYASGDRVRGHALEVFPHATGVRLGGAPASGPKRLWRRVVLERWGIDTSLLRSVDALDAALAALTGLLALSGRTDDLGDETGVIVVPAEGFEPPLTTT